MYVWDCIRDCTLPSSIYRRVIHNVMNCLLSPTALAFGTDDSHWQLFTAEFLGPYGTNLWAWRHYTRACLKLQETKLQPPKTVLCSSSKHHKDSLFTSLDQTYLSWQIVSPKVWHIPQSIDDGLLFPRKFQRLCWKSILLRVVAPCNASRGGQTTWTHKTWRVDWQRTSWCRKTQW